MSTKINRFNNEITPLWNEVQNFVNGIDELLISDEYIENFAYLKKITDFLSKAISCVDADFLPMNFIDNIKSYLNDIKNYLINTQNYTNFYYISSVVRITQTSIIFHPWKACWIICYTQSFPLFYIKEKQSKA